MIEMCEGRRESSSEKASDAVHMDSNWVNLRQDIPRSYMEAYNDDESKLDQRTAKK